MPSLKIELQTESGAQPVLTLSSVPQSLCESIRKGCTSITEMVGGKPELSGEEDLAICFPQVGLPDWIDYKWTARGELKAEGHMQGQLQGRDAQHALDDEFAHGSIVLLLESPHKHEMRVGRPAAGPTGRNIEAHRHHLETFLAPLVRQLYRSPEWESLPFVIVNPCPYPASCLAELRGC